MENIVYTDDFDKSNHPVSPELLPMLQSIADHFRIENKSIDYTATSHGRIFEFKGSDFTPLSGRFTKKDFDFLYTIESFRWIELSKLDGQLMIGLTF